MLFSKRKFVAIFITLLLILTPMQAAFASSVNAVCDMEQMDHSTMTMDQASISDCGMHDHEADCKGANCSAGHCVSVVNGLLPNFSFSSSFSNASDFIFSNDVFITQSISSLFRPPRV